MPPTPLELVEGALPPDMPAGCFMRNGPNPVPADASDAAYLITFVHDERDGDSFVSLIDGTPDHVALLGSGEAEKCASVAS